MNHIVTPEYLREQGLSPTFPERFWKRVNKNGPIQKHCPELGRCWEWTGWRKRGTWNYGGICVGLVARNITTYKASWILNRGPIPTGLCVLHKCDFCPCVNPDHLMLGTFKQNTQDAISKGRLTCGNHSGEHNGRATVTWKLVRAIRAEHKPWIVTKKQLAKRFGVSFHVVKAIVEHKTWKQTHCHS